MKRLLMTALLVLPIAALSRLPYSPAGAEDAVLRLSWRMSVSAKEQCRTRTQEELDALPVHMRTPQECRRDEAHYDLVMTLDSLRTDTLSLVRGGVKGDRPLFVMEDRTVSPGEHRVRLRLERRAGGSIETLAALDTVLGFERGHIRLVTLDADSGVLIAR